MAQTTVSRILVVDDEAMVADTLQEVLHFNGFESTAVYSGEEAVKTARWFHPDLLLLDLVMGRMNGMETASHIIKEDPHCRVLLFSGNLAMVSLLADTRVRGFNFDVMIKPVHPDVLVARLRHMGASSAKTR